MAVGVSGVNAAAAAAPGRRVTGVNTPVKGREGPEGPRPMEPMRAVGGGVPAAASRGRQTRRDGRGGGSRPLWAYGPTASPTTRGFATDPFVFLPPPRRRPSRRR